VIVEIVHFDLPSGTDRTKARELYRGSAAVWVTNKDLIEKYYFYNEADCRGGRRLHLDVTRSGAEMAWRRVSRHGPPHIWIRTEH